MTTPFAEQPVSRTRRVLVAVIVALGILLIALLIALLLIILRGNTTTSYPPVAGLRAIRVILGPGVGNRPLFDSPMGAAYGNDGRIYVADTGNDRIVVFDAEGRYLSQFGGFGLAKPARGGVFSWQPGRLNYPTDVATDEDGNVYVADFRNDQIQVFDPEGKFLRVFPDRDKPVGMGSSGRDGKGLAVTSLTVQDGRVYATDRFQVVVFDTNGQLLGQFGRPGSGPDDLDHPNGIALGMGAVVVVSDSNHNRVAGFSPGGRSVWSTGERLGDVTKSQGRGAFEIPRGIATANGGGFMVADALASKLVQLAPTGEFERSLGQPGAAPGELNFPTDVDSDGSTYLVAEKGNNRVQVVVAEGE